MIQRPVDVQPGTLGRAEHLLADAIVNPLAGGVFSCFRKHCSQSSVIGLRGAS
jgi:hypothetical protein